MKTIFERLLFLLIVVYSVAVQGQSANSKLIPYRLGNLWGYSDQRGNIVIPTRYQEAFPFFSGVAVVRQDNHASFLDAAGNLKIPFRYDFIGNFNSDGIALVSRSGKWGAIDNRGKEVVRLKYDGMNEFSEGYAAVKSGDKIGFVNKKG